MPDKADLASHTYAAASEVYSIDGILLGKYFIEDRVPITEKDIPLSLKQALIATEDVRFYSHRGVDERSLFRVFFKGFLGGDASAGGGSTLSQQLAKQWFPRKSFPLLSLMLNKFREMEIARRLERVYSKEEILTHYLNTVFLGDHSYGIETASKRYFSKGCAQLSLEEACTLVGMLKAPTSYNPRTNAQASRGRRNTVIRQMQKYGYLSSQLADSLVNTPLILKYQAYSHHEGLAPYFRSYLRQYLEAWIAANPKVDSSHWNLYRDGLKIITPIHSKLQSYAEKAVEDEMQKIQSKFDKEWRGKQKHRLAQKVYLQKRKNTHYYKRWIQEGLDEATIDSLFEKKRPLSLFSFQGPLDTLMSLKDSMTYSHFLLQAGFCAMDPASGFIRAWVGGIDHSHYQFDHVRALRQAGSAFKPIVYATALEAGVDPCEFTSNEQKTYARYENWSPSNSDKLYGGEYSMAGALTHSVNVVAVKIVMEIGASAVCRMAKQLGIPNELPEVPSIALGSAEIALQDLIGAYCTISNRGKKVRPQALVRIESSSGEILYDATQALPQTQVIQRENSDMLLSMMKGVIDRGTGKSLRRRYKLSMDMAGKTGTTQKQTDGWFIGLTPNLAAGAWVGADDQRIHFRTMAGQGATTALPIYGSFMRMLLKDEEFKSLRNSRFPALSPSLQEKLDCPAFTFPLNMEDFREWWQSKYGKEDEPDFDGIMEVPQGGQN
ncbi:MAG: transglycosylase domain-containing protein [Bacteroidia bacterium]|nr:transglycosylase domain-containing protein [Bacteroidia bacterium]